MGILLVALAAIITGLILTNQEKTENLGIVMFVIGASIGLIAFAWLGSEYIGANIDAQEIQMEREMLEYRLEEVEGLTIGNELLYDDILEFNQERLRCKYWNDNFWTGIFIADIRAEIEPIEIEVGE